MSVLKKFALAFAVCLLCLASCQRENRTLRLIAESYHGGKMHLDDAHYACWDNGDSVVVNENAFQVIVNEQSAIITDVEEASAYYAVYPARWVTGNAGTTTTLTMPEKQSFRTLTDGTQVLDAPMAAACTGQDRLAFHNLGSLLAVNVSNDGNVDMAVRRIEVEAQSGVLLCGTATITEITSDAPVLTLTSGSNKVSLCFTGNDGAVAAQDDRTFYIALPPITNAKLTIKVYDDYTCYSRSQASSNTTFVRNSAHAVTFATSEADCELLAPRPNEIWYTATGALNISGESYDPVTHKGVITYSQPVTTLSHYDFSGNTSLTSVTLPEGLETISGMAFANCYYLTSVHLPSTLKVVKYSAFMATGITSISFPAGITRIENGIFSYCSNLSSVVFEGDVESIESYLFTSCGALTSVEFRGSKPYTIPATFCAHCSHLKSVTLPSGTKTIDSAAFFACDSLKSITLPNSTTHIGARAFQGSGLTTINLSRVTHIDASAFKFSKITSANLSGAKSIGDEAFYQCKKLSQVTCGSALRELGSASFRECTNLNLISLYPAINLKGISPYAFKGCTSLTSIALPDNLDSIANDAFASCSALQTIFIPASVWGIYDNAFLSCTNLTVYCYPSYPPGIGTNAFGDNNSHVSHIYVKPLDEQIYRLRWSQYSSIISGNSFLDM